jgi:hypothetical protein
MAGLELNYNLGEVTRRELTAPARIELVSSVNSWVPNFLLPRANKPPRISAPS